MRIGLKTAVWKKKTTDFLELTLTDGTKKKIRHYNYSALALTQIQEFDQSITKNNLKSIDNIPLCVTDILIRAFYQCACLTTFSMSSNISFIGYEAFFNCNKLEKMIIPINVTSIETYTFAFCESLKNVIIPIHITDIGSFAFSKCSALTNIIIPVSVTNIGRLAFEDCSGLTQVKFEGKTKLQIKAMSNYPWGLNENIIIPGIY